jgi:hypothetical protein
MDDQTSALLPTVAAGTAPLAIERDPTLLAGIAHEIAWDIDSLPNILQKYGLSQHEFEARIQTNEFYKRILDKAIDEWHKADSTERRLQMKARVALELNMHHIVNRIKDASEPLNSVTQAGKLIAEIGNLVGVNKPAASATGEKVVINIDLSGKKLRYEKDVTPIESTGAVAQIQSQPERETKGSEIQNQPEGEENIS